jgi:phosphoglycolate phosphatase-like HAD superfamily hydrolase
VRRLILWDIDGTLIRSGKVGRQAVEAGAAAAASLVDVPVVVMSGKTDPQILREIFVAAEIADEHIAELLPHATAATERALAEAEADLRRDGRVLPGVVDLLEALGEIDGVRQTLLTGNLVANAALKVAAFDLLGYFDVEIGAYGTDHEDRRELVPIALERVQRLRGEHYDKSEVWVIGDTANDLACARAAGVRCLLVGTGASEVDEALGADAHLPDLSNTEGVVSILLASA